MQYTTLTTHRDLRNAAESLAVPSWSTNLSIPWTLELILKTWSDSED